MRAFTNTLYNFKLHFRHLLYPGYLHIASRGRRYRRYPWYGRADTYATRLLYPNARPVHILSFGAHRIRSYERVPAVRGPGRIRPGCRRRIRLVSCFSNFWMFDEVLDVKSYFDDAETSTWLASKIWWYNTREIMSDDTEDPLVLIRKGSLIFLSAVYLSFKWDSRTGF